MLLLANASIFSSKIFKKLVTWVTCGREIFQLKEVSDTKAFIHFVKRKRKKKTLSICKFQHLVVETNPL